MMMNQRLLPFLAVLAALLAGGCTKDTASSAAGPAAPAGTDRIHHTSLAGSWYPADPEALRRMIEEALEPLPAPDPEEAARLIALIVPHAGYAYSAGTAAYGYRFLQARRPRRVVLLGPSHRTSFRGVSFGDFNAYETPLGRVRVDPEAARRMGLCPLVAFHESAHLWEHSVDIQIPFLQVLFPDAPPVIVPLLVGRLEEADYPVLAAWLRPLLDDRTVLVVSSDFTHYGPRYGYTPFPHSQRVSDALRSLDEGAFSAILGLSRAAFLAYQARTGITVCGRGPIAELLELLPPGTQPRQLHYATSVERTGDDRNSVSYAAFAFFREAGWAAPASHPTAGTGEKPAMKQDQDRATGSRGQGHGLTREEELTLLRLARDTLDAKVRRKRLPDVADGPYAITPALRQRRGAFVTLKKHQALRGCIGYIQPIAPLVESVQQNTVNAATRDSRFPTVRPDELGDIEIEISALTPPQRVGSYRDIELGKHGIILRKGGAQAVFLPQVATEQGWDLAETLRHLARKAGLPADAWKDPDTEFHVFTAEVFHEK